MIEGDVVAITAKLNPSYIFDPSPSYDGEWKFDINNLLRNSKKENDVNLFEEFLKKIYKEPLLNIFKIMQVLDFKVSMISQPNENNIGRCLRFSRTDFIVEIILFLDQYIDRYGKTLDEHNNYLKELLNHLTDDNETLYIMLSNILKEKADKLKDVIDKEFNSQYFEAAMKDYAQYKDSMDFSKYIKSIHAITVAFQNGLLRLGDFFDRSIDYEELASCFDPDTFYLLFAKIIYEDNLFIEREDGCLDNNYSYLYFYNLAVEEEIKQDKKYDPKIFYTLPTGSKIRYSRRQFQQEHKTLIERHPEVKQINLPNLEEANPEKYKDIELITKIAALYNEETSVNWQFLPEGEGIKKSPQAPRNIANPTKKKDKEVLIQEVNTRIAILENSGFIGRPIKGLDSFTGYYAFVYPNGKVILEKFWENEENMTPALGYATYVMTIDNFVEMSKLSRINLIEYIKTLPEIGVKRIFHTSIDNWQKNLYDEINGTYRLEDAIEFINSLKSGALNND